MSPRVKTLFESHGSVHLYVGLGDAPRSIRFGNKTYYRYMDRLFLPAPPWQLGPAETTAVAELRSRLGPEIVDVAFTQRVLGVLLRTAAIAQVSTLLDFGCGDGNIAAHVSTVPDLRPKEIVGVDLSEALAAVADEKLNAMRLGTAVRVETTNLGLESNYFDAAVANFVMQFPVYRAQMEDLFRALKRGRRLVYNSHYCAAAPDHHGETITMLSEVGFRVSQVTVEVSRGSERYPETIVVCEKP